MRNSVTALCLLVMFSGCAATSVTDEQVQDVATSLDFGDYSSSTLASKSWAALAAKDYPATLAYTGKCVELYGEQGKKMNASLTTFAPVEKVNDFWALNDAGVCMYIMALTYEKLRMYPEAGQAFRSVTDDYSFAQCWDPKGWYWHPAFVAAGKADKYARYVYSTQ